MGKNICSLNKKVKLTTPQNCEIINNVQKTSPNIILATSQYMKKKIDYSTENMFIKQKKKSLISVFKKTI